MKASLKTIVPTVVAALCIGAGAGAGIYAALSSTGGTKTVVHQVTVGSAQPAASTSGLSIGEIYRRTYKGVVEITVSSTGSSQFGGLDQAQQAQGSGFVYDSKGDIVTNQHVVDGASSISVKFSDGTTRKATVVGSDASTDLAVIRVVNAPSSLLSPITLGDSTKLAVGDGVVAIGSPFGLSETVTSGIVSALHRQMTSPNNFTIDDSIQTDAAINHGNSGGPLLNTQAQVIGVNAQIQSDSGGNEGVGFAIPSSTVRNVVTQLLGSGKVQHAYLGVAISSSGGAKITNLTSGAPAVKAGLQVGDTITGVGGTKITSADELRAAISARSPGQTVSITYTRGGKSHTVSVKLADRPS